MHPLLIPVIAGLCIVAAAAPRESTIINASQYHSIPNDYFLEQRLTSVIMPENDEDLSYGTPPLTLSFRFIWGTDPQHR